MKRILVFNRVFFRISETFIHRQVCGLNKNFNVELLAFHYENHDAYEPCLVAKHRIPTSKNLIDRILTALGRQLFRMDLFYSIRVCFYLNRVFKNVDAVHAHYGHNALQILSVAKKNKRPLVVSFHGWDASAAIATSYYKGKLSALFDYSSAIIICSPHMQQTLQLTKWREKVHVVPYGVNTEEFKSAALLSCADKLRILHTGRVVPKKGVPDLIRVVATLYRKYPFIELLVLGDGSELASCKDLVSENEMQDYVKFFGAQPSSVVKNLMQDADIFVLNSRTADDGDMEGLPNALLEAMSFQKAVVSTFHAGIPMAIIPEYNGLLVPEKDNVALADALERLIMNNDLRIELGRNARKSILDNFTVEKMQSHLHEIFEGILTCDKRRTTK